MVTEERGTFKNSATNEMQASLARPSRGGGGEGDLQGVADLAGDGILLGAGVDLDLKRRSRCGVADRESFGNPHILSAPGGAPLQRCNFAGAYDGGFSR